jgi:putative nucleotidyltransferase with HDIG domain
LLRTPRKRLGVLHLDRGPMQKPFTKDDLHLADALAAHVSAGIESAQLIKKQKELFHATIAMLAQAVELRDPYTGGHTVRVTEYSMLLGQQLELSREDMDLIRIGTPLHDIGKIGIDDAILRKPGKLTAQEFDIMKSHTTKGAKILEQVGDLASVIPIVRSHHERWDGFGYPDGLAGENIPRLARIVGVCDAFDAMTSDRPYRQGMPAEVAFAEVDKQKGKQFDLHAAGMLALDVARVEAGLLLIEVDYISSKKALIASQKYSPYELGFGKMVHLDKENFIGKRALEKDAKNGVPRQLVGLVVDWTDVEQLYERYGLTPAAPTQASRVPVPVYAGDRQVGKATTTTWSPTLKKMIALATLETEYSKPGTDLQMEITIEAIRLKTNVKVATLPFFNPARKTATPV